MELISELAGKFKLDSPFLRDRLFSYLEPESSGLFVTAGFPCPIRTKSLLLSSDEDEDEATPKTNINREIEICILPTFSKSDQKNPCYR